jgi:hypothetical protein
MKKTHPALWAAGWAGVAIGAILVIGAVGTFGEFATLAGGYGLMLIGAAAYLLAGLKVRERFNARSSTTAVQS